MTTTVVTGSAGGIGSATVSAFEAAGHTVHGIDVGDDPAAVFGRLDRLDVFVCAHGMSGRSLGDGPVDTCPEEAWDAVLDSNLRSVFLYCKRAVSLCNVVCPGLIETPMSRRAQDDPKIRARVRDLQPLTGTFGRPDDVAAAAVYLATAPFVTGAVLTVDGGWTAV
jgi:NAD(P)-dependent dehydrogenase (short-subunit alcohol dehydrogenase family)